MAVVAILVRCDGWGPETPEIAAAWPKWKRWLSEFFSAWTCGVICMVATYATFADPLAAIAVGLGFVLWRAPELGDYWGADFKQWPKDFLRGAITTLPLFATLSLIFYGDVLYAILCVPMGIMQMLLYNGLQRFNRDVRSIPLYHVIAELGTGFTFAGCIKLIFTGV